MKIQGNELRVFCSDISLGLRTAGLFPVAFDDNRGCALHVEPMAPLPIEVCPRPAGHHGNRGDAVRRITQLFFQRKQTPYRSPEIV